jgi:chromosome segregation ATPase
MTDAHEGTGQLWTDEKLHEQACDVADHSPENLVIRIRKELRCIRDFYEDNRANLQAALAEKEALVSELQDALDGMRGIAKGRLEKIAELEAQVRKLKAEKQEAIEMIRSLGLPIEDIEVETMTREQYEKEYGDDD